MVLRGVRADLRPASNGGHGSAELDVPERLLQRRWQDETVVSVLGHVMLQGRGVVNDGKACAKDKGKHPLPSAWTEETREVAEDILRSSLRRLSVQNLEFKNLR